MKLCLVSSPGGHLTEMRELCEAFEGHEVCYLTYPSNRLPAESSYVIENPASRPWTLPVGILRIARMILRERPTAMISTGAEIAVPAFLVARVFGVRTIFIETCARISAPSVTAVLTYPLSNYFFVQRKALLKFFGRKAAYEGGLL